MKQPFFGGAQVAIDTMLVSPLDCDDSPHLRANEDGVVLQVAHLRKHLSREVGGCWWEET